MTKEKINELRKEKRERKRAVKILDKALGLLAEAKELTENYVHDGDAINIAIEAVEDARHEEEISASCIDDELNEVSCEGREPGFTSELSDAQVLIREQKRLRRKSYVGEAFFEGHGTCRVYAFDHQIPMQEFLDKVGGLPHPLEGFRVIVPK